MNKLILLFLLSIFTFSFNAQSYENIVPPDYINGIQLFNPVTQNQSPFIQNGEYFVLSFDDLNSTYQRYFYYIKHYDRNWESSDLFESEYTNGYFTDDIQNYKPSFNALQTYVHYELTFPNARMQPKLSGNYALYVYSQDKKKPLFSVRFSVFENQVLLGVRETVFTKSNDKANQRLEVVAQSNGQFNLNDNIQQTSLTLLQNNDWNHQIADIEPQFTFNNRLEFNQINLVFEGGNEFYWFDTKNIETRALTTQNIAQDDLFYAFLFPNEIYPTIYNYNPDVNGAFYVRRNDTGVERVADTDGDYVHVNFALVTPLLKDTKIYVVGAFNQYARNTLNEMSYNTELGLYECDILLKQGYYNYQFVAEDSKGNLNYALNGNFWETENLYTALLYFYDFRENYDRLIGLGEQ